MSGAENSNATGKIILSEGDAVAIGYVRDVVKLFRAILDLVTSDVYLYLEDPASPEVEEYLEANKVNAAYIIEPGTLWPKPKKYHILFSSGAREQLIAFAERLAATEVAAHVVVYQTDGTVLIEAYDLGDNIVRAHKSLSSQVIKQLRGAAAAAPPGHTT